MSAASSKPSGEFECSPWSPEIDHHDTPDGRIFPCPICKAEVTIPAGGISNLKTDFKRKSILEQYIKLETDQPAKRRKMAKECTACGQDATVFCEQCGSVYLCTPCREKHGVSSATMNHTLLPLCADHSKTLSYFCMKCSECVCSICSFSLHQNHDVRLRSDITNEVFSKLPAVVTKLHDVSRRFQRAIESYSRNINVIYPKDEHRERSNLGIMYSQLAAASSSEMSHISDQMAHLKQQLKSLKSKKAGIKKRKLNLEKKAAMKGIEDKYAQKKQDCQQSLEKAKREKTIISRHLQLSEDILRTREIKKETYVSAVELVLGDAKLDEMIAEWGHVSAFR